MVGWWAGGSDSGVVAVVGDGGHFVGVWV